MIVALIQVLGLEELDLSDIGLGHFRFRKGGEDERWNDIERLLVRLKSIGDDDHPTVAAVLARFWHDYADVLAEHLPRLAPLTEQQVCDLAADRWCHLGSHGHAHRQLTRLDEHELAYSLVESRRVLGESCESPIPYLAYPNGDHDPRVTRAAAVAGYRRAWTVVAGIHDSSTDPLAIPRVGVSGCGPDCLLRFQLTRQLMKDRLA